MGELFRCDIRDIDLNKPLLRSNVGVVLATGDKLANRFGVNVYRQRDAVDLTGSAVTGYFIRPNTETVVITGTVEGNKAFVDLPQACYTGEGSFSLAIKIDSGSMANTVRIVDGYIRLTQTDALIDPGEAVPTLDDIFAQMAAVETAAQAANEAASSANAAAEKSIRTDMQQDLTAMERMQARENIGKMLPENMTYIDSNVLYDAEEIRVSGSGTYVHHDIVLPAVVGETYTFSVRNVEGCLYHYAIIAYALNASGATLSQAKAPTGVVENVSVQITAPEGTTDIKYRLYATASGGLSDTAAVYSGILILRGTKAERTISKDVTATAISAAAASRHALSATVRSISHRGASDVAPECTAPAYIAARRKGYTIAENDVQVTSDGELVMWHDSNLAKIGDSSHAISDYTLAELKAKDFGSWFGAEFAGTQILTFAEWAALCKKLGMDMYIDRKITFTAEQMQYMINVVRRLGMLRHVSWLGGSTMYLVREYDPLARCVLLNAPTEELVARYTTFLEQGGEGSVVFEPQCIELTAEMAALALDAGYGLECWHVDYAGYGFDTEDAIFGEIDRVMGLGVQGITLDKYRVEDAIDYLYMR